VRYFRRYLLITLFLSVLAFFLHWNQRIIMKADLRYFRDVQACLERGDVGETIDCLAKWCEANPDAPQDSRYTAALAGAAAMKKNQAVVELGRTLTVNNVLAGR
jgi:hypothetical protein